MRRALVVAAALGAACRAKPTPAPAKGDTPTVQDAGAFDAERYRVRANVPAIAWSIATKDVLLVGAAGKEKLEPPVVATGDTVFEAASIGKLFVALAVMRELGAKPQALDEDISRWVGFPVRHPRGAVTLRRLLTHTADIVDLPSAAVERDFELGPFLRHYFEDSAAFGDVGPGRAMRYSNVGASLAALAVERTAQQSFDAYAKAWIFPGLPKTQFGRPPASLTATHYALENAAFIARPPRTHAVYPAVDFYSTARDLGRFGQALLGEARAGVYTAPDLDAMYRAPSDAAPDQGLGFQRRTIGGREVLGHEGEDVSASSAFYVAPAIGRAVTVLANGDAFASGDDDRIRAIGDLVAALLEAPLR